MKYISFILFFVLLVSCVSPSTSSSLDLAIDEFLKTSLSNKQSLIAKFGEPSDKEENVINGEKLQLWSYNTKNGSYEFLIKNDQNIAEKRFFPLPDSKFSKLNHLLKNEFPTIQFDRIPVKCRHYNEIILANKDLGIFILSKEEESSEAALIMYAEPNLFDFRLNENKQRKCKY